MIVYAYSSRPDIQISKTRVEDTKRVLALERKRILANVESGIAYAREPDGDDFMGPEVEIQLPIFDQNQAQIVRAEYKLRQAEKELRVKAGLLRGEVSATFEKKFFSKAKANLLRDNTI